MEIRPAVKSDLEALMRIFENAKQIMRSSGNMLQWNDGYPSEAVVLKDICNGHCHVAASPLFHCWKWDCTLRAAR